MNDIKFKVSITPAKTNNRMAKKDFNGFAKIRNGHYFSYGTFNSLRNKSGIYKLVCSVNGMIYIGSSTDIGARISKHFSNLRHNKHPNKLLSADYSKYGEKSFSFEVIEFCNDNLKDKERDYQNSYPLQKLYNLQIKDTYHSDSQRLGYKTRDMSSHKSVEYRQKMSTIKSNKIGQFDIKTKELINIYENSAIVCAKFGMARSTLLGCCNGSKKATKGYIWKYLNENNEIIKKGIGKHRNDDIVLSI